MTGVTLLDGVTLLPLPLFLFDAEVPAAAAAVASSVLSSSLKSSPEDDLVLPVITYMDGTKHAAWGQTCSPLVSLTWAEHVLPIPPYRQIPEQITPAL